ncbi:adenosine receptor A3-like [Paramacrobiotus metropolitanus]|uniref:adenosine receptor A3-like n=1 Tax=Paramacrobiotus metropolitanus TaxID=2943436 RepID=UPI002445E5C7|nr:adenosine receptor A3-like [Paramacrobiotus metropolitanus]
MTANNTTNFMQSDRWTPLFCTQTVIAITAFLLNAAVLIRHLLQPSIISHFTVYLLVLYLANVVIILGVKPMELFNDIHNGGNWSFGGQLCIIHTYFLLVFSVTPLLSHLLIATDRFWALQFPHSYRSHHNIKTSLLICLGMVCYVHCFALPAFIVYLPSINAAHCQPSPRSRYWYRVEYVIDRIVPLLLILVIYLFIIIKRWHRRKTPASVHVSPAGSRIPHSTTVLAVRRTSVRPFVVLTLTTLEVAVCWLPLDVYFACKVYFNYRMPDSVAQCFVILFTLQSVFDPLIWVFSRRHKR